MKDRLKDLLLVVLLIVVLATPYMTLEGVGIGSEVKTVEIISAKFSPKGSCTVFDCDGTRYYSDQDDIYVKCVGREGDKVDVEIERFYRIFNSDNYRVVSVS